MTEVELVERLVEASAGCLRDDLADIAHYMRAGYEKDRTEPIAAVIREYAQKARALELSYWFGWLQYTDETDLPRLRGRMRERLAELEAE